MFSKASVMPLAMTSWLQPYQIQKYLFSNFYLFEIKFSFQVWQGPQPGYQHHRLNCRLAKLEMLQNKISKTKKQKIKKIQIFFETFQIRQACTDSLARARQLWKFFKMNHKNKIKKLKIKNFKCGARICSETFLVWQAPSHTLGTEAMAGGPPTLKIFQKK
jgi:hypothetical protein